MTDKRPKHNHRAIFLAWAVFAIALMVVLPNGNQASHQDADLLSYPQDENPYAHMMIDPITTSSLRGSSHIHLVSQTQLLQLANAEVSLNVGYSDEQLRTKIHQLNELDAVQSKCFRVEPYDVSPLTSKDWQRINYKLVASYIDDGMPENTPVSREKIMADIWLMREAALQAEGTPQRVRSFGLYLLQVQSTLLDAHKHFGDDGFKWAQKLVRTEYDYELAEHIVQIIPSKFYTRRLNQNMQLFAQDVSQFIPCTVRAKQILNEQASSS